jgi:uncharacterized protein (TIGR02466 family)
MFTLKEKSLTKGFYTPIEWYEVEEARSLNAALLADIAARRKQSEGLVRSNRLGWHSENDLFERPEASFRQLCDIIVACVAKTTSRHFANADIADLKEGYHGWVNVNMKGAYNAPHNHIGCLWSGTYYVSVPKTNFPDSGAIEFMDPRSAQTQGIKGSSNSFLNPKMKFVPEVGSLVVFPSYLLHWVYPNEHEEERVSIAFNMKLVK